MDTARTDIGGCLRTPSKILSSMYVQARKLLEAAVRVQVHLLYVHG